MINYFVYETLTSKMIVGQNADGSALWIPVEPKNTDYQAYLAWVAEGNTAEEWQPEGE